MRMIRPLLVALLVTLLATPVTLAQWPATCVDLNDLIEAHRGNPGNVGIYQRVHGDQAETACRQDHAATFVVVRGRPYQVPPRTNPAAYTQAFVEQAIARLTTQGGAATLAYYNTSTSMDGSWYVFILDRTGAIVAHAARPERLGLTLDDLTDVRGYHYGAAFAAIPEGEGRWVSYGFVNPATGQQAQKHSWVVRVDGLLVGSGWYETGVSAA